jgi:Tol biopolymer transport system component
MKTTKTAAVPFVLCLLCASSPAVETETPAKGPRLIVAPHGGVRELRIVELGRNDSTVFPIGLDRPLFPSWRDKGRRLVFTSNASGTFQIYAIDAAGGVARNLTGTTTEEDQPACSPDGTKILFTSNRDGNRELYVMDSDGKNQVNLTNDPGFDSDSAWSPDGKRIAFASDRSGKGFHLMVMNADGSEPRNLIDRNLGGMLYPCWSPDGQQIAFSSLVQPDVLRLYVANADGAGMQELTEGPGMSCYPCWSPDGRYLAYVHFPRHPNQSPEGGRLMLIDLEAGTTSEFGDTVPHVIASRMAWLPEEE